ncbi:MAG: PEP-CTERM sorting domain-containing protein [Verrucomicrobiales bacterium]|nr:PEP-CTERM sorting domain-containing protein [Verrucomicrobiales bacterium]
MTTSFKSAIFTAYHSFGGAVCAGAVMLIAAGAQAQNLFVAVDGDTGPFAHSIIEITPGGTQSIFASGLANSYGMAVNSAGNLFYAENSGNIYKFTPGGMQSTFVSGVAGSLAFDSADNLYAADGGNIYKFAPDGTQSTFASGVSGSLVFDSADNLFVLSGGSIYKYTPGGVQSTPVSGIGYSAFGLAVNSAGSLFVSEQASGGNIYEYTPGGVQSTFVSGLAGPAGLAFDSAGNLWVADNLGIRINEYSPDGTLITHYDPPGVLYPSYLAFQPVPEPSALGLLAIAGTVVLVSRRRKRHLA